MKKFFLAYAFLFIALVSIQARPPKVPTYVDFAGQRVMLDSPDRQERMDKEILAFCYMHSTSTQMLKRSKRVFDIVVPILRRYSIPEDLKYLMVIESNLDPQAHSPAGAAGLWQFMQTSGREYGLEVNANVDERYNIRKSTEAACKYLKALYDRFGDWMAVAACYNSGPAGIASRMETQLSDDAMELWVPAETSRYMFRVLTAKLFFEDPLAFGIEIDPSEYYTYPQIKEVVTTTDPIPDLAAFAASKGVSFYALKKANLWLRESKLNNSTHRRYEIIIPER